MICENRDGLNLNPLVVLVPAALIALSHDLGEPGRRLVAAPRRSTRRGGVTRTAAGRRATASRRAAGGAIVEEVSLSVAPARSSDSSASPGAARRHRARAPRLRAARHANRRGTVEFAGSRDQLADEAVSSAPRPPRLLRPAGSREHPQPASGSRGSSRHARPHAAETDRSAGADADERSPAPDAPSCAGIRTSSRAGSSSACDRDRARPASRRSSSSTSRRPGSTSSPRPRPRGDRPAAARAGLAMVYVSHDLAVVAQIADRIAVMYAGRIVEEGPTAEILARRASVHARARRVDPRPPAPRRLRGIPGVAVGRRRAPPGARSLHAARSGSTMRERAARLEDRRRGARPVLRVAARRRRRSGGRRAATRTVPRRPLLAVEGLRAVYGHGTSRS